MHPINRLSQSLKLIWSRCCCCCCCWVKCIEHATWTQHKTCANLCDMHVPGRERESYFAAKWHWPQNRSVWNTHCSTSNVSRFNFSFFSFHPQTVSALLCCGIFLPSNLFPSLYSISLSLSNDGVDLTGLQLPKEKPSRIWTPSNIPFTHSLPFLTL